MRRTKPSKTPPAFSRMLREDASLTVRPLGQPFTLSDFYHKMLRVSWPALFAIYVLSFLAFNLLFAGLYVLDPNGLHVGTPMAIGPYWRAFFFSLDTIATVGYGNISPISLYTNILSAIQITLSILFFAIVTGIIFARFSRPRARILFSDVAVVSDIDGVPTLMFRAANQRHNLIFEVSAAVSLLSDEALGGTRMRRFHDMQLIRSSNPVFALTWTLMHPIDADSPLRDWLEGQAPAPKSEIVVVVSGTDGLSGQLIHGRWAYGPGDIRWNARFVDILGQEEDGTRTIDYGRFHDIERAGGDPVPANA
jgi:inward rectifier potassium channel